MDDIEKKVVAIVADALSQDPTEVKAHSSLMDDLGAESIDFIDIVFRLESEFGMIIPNEDLWAGSVQADSKDPAAITRGVAALKQRMPDFAWDRFPNGVTRNDLPRLVTVNTVVEYLRKRIDAEAAS